MDAATVLIAMMVRAYPDPLKRRKEWKTIAEEAGIVIEEDAALLQAEKDAAIRQAHADYGVDE